VWTELYQLILQKSRDFRKKLLNFLKCSIERFFDIIK